MCVSTYSCVCVHGTQAYTKHVQIGSVYSNIVVLLCVVVCVYIFICMCIRNTGVDNACAKWQAASGSYTLKVDDNTDGLFAIMLYRTSLSSLHYLDGQKVCCSVLQRVAACCRVLERDD